MKTRIYGIAGLLIGMFSRSFPEFILNILFLLAYYGFIEFIVKPDKIKDKQPQPLAPTPDKD